MPSSKNFGSHNISGRLKYLLFSILVLLIIYPFLDDGISGAAVTTLVLTAILISGIYALGKSLTHIIMVSVVGVPWLVITWVGIFENIPMLINLQPVFGIAFFAVVIGTLLLHVVKTKEVTSDILYGAICIYLLTGLLFAEVFLLFQNDVTAFSHVLDWTERVYFSFSTLTTVGYGDIVAKSNVARAVANLESVLGVMYTTVILARLVALYTAQHAEKIVKAQTELEIQKRRNRRPRK